jgi:lipid-binding SYLF domain-containing protein
MTTYTSDNAKRTTRRAAFALAAGALAAFSLTVSSAYAGAVALDQNARAALARLYGQSVRAKEFGKLAVGILVVARIVKAGLILGGMSGDGVLYEHGRITGYYNMSGASWGLQAGAETYAYALFFLKPKALAYLHKSSGWAIGSGPSVVVADKSIAESGDTTTLTQDVYAVPFSSKGLMGSLSLQGTKITPIHPKP